MASLPLQYFGVAFNADPFDSTATPVWSDLTVRLRGVSQAGRGRQYELDQVQAGALNAAWYDIDEALNPVNTGSAFSPNVLPYRQAVYMAQWPPAPVGGAVNLLNLANPDYTVDGSFESYATGSVPSWVLTAGAIGAPGVTTTNPQQGTKAFSYNVAAGGGTMGIGVNIPTIPGKQYTCSWYVRQTAANTTQIFINGGAGGTSTALINTYVRLTVTFTASQPTHQVYIASFATASNGTVFCDAVQHEPGAAASAFSVTGPLLRNVWTRGYVERWPTAWDSNGYEGLSSTPVVGPFAILNNAYLHTELWGSIAAKRPDYYWPLSEASGATLFADNSGNSGPSLFAVASPIGTAGSTFAPGTTTNIPGEPGRTGVRTAPVAGQEGQLNQPFTILQLGYKTPQIVGPSAASGSITTWGMTYSFVLTRPSATLNNQVIFVRFTSLIPGNTVNFPVGAGSAGQVSPGSVTDVWGDGKPHLYTFTVALAAGTLTQTLYIDGAIVSNSATPGFGTGLTAPTWAVEVGGKITFTFNQAGQDQTMQDLAYWNRTLSAFEVADLSNAFKGYPGEGSGARIKRYLSIGGFTGPTNIDTGSSLLGVSALTEGTTVLAGCQGVAASEFGNFFEAASGVTFASRFSRYLAVTSKYTFGENVAGGEYPYLGDINFDIDPNLVLNIADITQTAGIVAHVEDIASEKRYGHKNFARTVALQSANEVIDAATWVVYNRKAALNRVNGVTLDPAACGVLPFGDGSMWAMILSLEVGTRVTLRRRPKSANAGAGITMSGDYFIEQITHHDIDVENGTWLVTLQLSPVPAAQPWILENATYGQLDVTTILGF
jgi:hypothetical protein